MLSLIYPDYCYSCGKFGESLCKTCKSLIHLLPHVRLPISSDISLDVHAISKYERPMESLIKKKFYSDIKCSQLVADIILDKIDLKLLNIDCVVPIPLHWRRFALRGFNQSEVIARRIAEEIGVPCLNLLKRVRNTKFQSSLIYGFRSKNLKNAFCLNMDVSFKNILIVDDLFTTGSTLKSASKALLKLSPDSLTAVVACRSVKE